MNLDEDVRKREITQIFLVHTVCILSPSIFWYLCVRHAVNTNDGDWIWHMLMWTVVFLVNILLQIAVGAAAIFKKYVSSTNVNF